MRNKKILIGLFISLVLVVIILFTLSFKKNETNTDNQVTVKDSTPVKSLDIKNLYLYSKDLDSTTQSTIETSVYNTIETTNPKTGQFSGIVRKDSYKNSSDGTLSTITFLVDISQIKQTYKLSLGSDSSTGENSLYVLCPSSKELIYPAFDCKDEVQ